MILVLMFGLYKCLVNRWRHTNICFVTTIVKTKLKLLLD